MIIKNLIYILQSEGYDYKRFLKFVYKNPRWWNFEMRKKIDWTHKAKILWLLTVCLFVVCLIFGALLSKLWVIILIPILIVLLPYLLGISLLLIRPIDSTLKKKRVKRAKEILNQLKIITIGITGSYGKTSTKEIITAILSEKLKVIKTPDNINTDIGIADFIINNEVNFKNKDVFIVEMGAYKIGDISNTSKMIEPQYSILTGINESHLERFGSLENIIRGKFELPSHTKDFVVLNFDDINIVNNYKKFQLKNFIGKSINETSDIVIKGNFQGLKFTYHKNEFDIKLLAKHNITLILLCIEVAKKIGINMEEIKRGVSRLKPFSHRLEPIYNPNTQITVIDDSYNGNFNGIISGLEILSQTKGRKIVLTPGLVETGKETEKIHKKIGNLYAQNIDLALFLKTKAVNYIIEGIKENQKDLHYKTYNTAKEAHDDLVNILQTGDTIIFQNDIPDHYR